MSDNVWLEALFILLAYLIPVVAYFAIAAFVADRLEKRDAKRRNQLGP